MASAIQKMGNPDFLRDLMMLQKKLSKAHLELMVTMCWAIWHARNRFVFEGLKLDPILVMTKVDAVKEAFRKTKFSELLNSEIM